MRGSPSLNHFSTNGCIRNHLSRLYKYSSLSSSIIVCLPVCQTKMAFKTKLLSVVVMAIVLAFLVVVQPPSDNGARHGQLLGEEGTLRQIHNRKLVLVSIKTKEEGLRKDVNGWSRSKSSSTSDAGKMVVGWELRKVPSGPDPLHHNGGSPKKPTTP